MPAMQERILQLTERSLRQVARHRVGVDMTISPNGAEPPDPSDLLSKIRRIALEKPQDVRILRRRVKRRSS